MKKVFNITSAIVIVSALLLATGCKKQEPVKLSVISTTTVTNITAATATSGGTITTSGGAAITSRGVCWGMSANPTTSDSKTSNGTGTGQFVSEITGLTAGTTYHVRAYAVNTAGTAYGADVQFATPGQAPSCETLAATNISATGATLNGTVNPNDLSTIVTFEYGTTTGYGSTITAAQSPATGNTVTNESADVTGLTPGTTYHFRIKTENSAGTVYGDDLTFITPGQAPSCETLPATNISVTGAILNGTLNPNYLTTTVTFEYGTTTDYGSTIPALPSPATGSTIISESAEITGLTAGTTYHFRIKAVNELGTTYGSDMSFTTYSGTVTDADGNVYYTITFGTQEWMAENLKTTRYSDATGIQNVTDNTTWKNLTDAAYCDYNNTPSNSEIYGRLYNWYAVNTDKNICPTGWHVPIDTEWTTLENFLIANGYNFDGTISGAKIAKSLAATTLWNVSGTAGAVGNTDYPAYRNKTNFSALPSGSRDFDGAFHSIGVYCTWWSATEQDSVDAWTRFLFYDSGMITRNDAGKEYGFSIRCVKD